MAGRHKLEIDQKQFEKLCAIMCTEVEIAGFFNVSHDTIARWCKRTYNKTFEEVYKDKSSIGKISLRRMQFKQAESNSSMAIWLGKQYLDQKDQVETVSTDKIEIVNDIPKM